MNAMMDRQIRPRLWDAPCPGAEHSKMRAPISSTVSRPFCSAATLGLAAVAYMVFEAQWIRCREVELSVPGLPPEWSGLRVLHLSDVHAGLFPTNERSLQKAVRWATPRAPDLVLLTGDVLGDHRRSRPCLELLTRLRPPLGTFAVTGNHEYGIGKDPLARPRDTSRLWEQVGITLLIDRCVPLPARKGSRIILCGADYLTGGHGLVEADGLATGSDADFPILLIHEPPPAGSPLAKLFPLAFAGHTHGGQLRLPGRDGLEPIHREGGQYLEGVQTWGGGRLVVSRGVGTSFLPFRMLTRPEASLWRLV
jgi:predicted MPP superfamily phosphohydrolase